MNFSRTGEYQAKFLLEALCDDKEIYQDITIKIMRDPAVGKLRAYCFTVNSYLQFPTALRTWGAEYIADIVEVLPAKRKHYFRVMRNSIRRAGSNQVCG